jgi:hypothetical protein
MQTEHSLSHSLMASLAETTQKRVEMDNMLPALLTASSPSASEAQLLLELDSPIHSPYTSSVLDWLQTLQTEDV